MRVGILGSGLMGGKLGTIFARAALWRDGVAIDLNSRVAPGWLLVSAIGINDIGQIVGTALRGGQRRALLLTPEYLAR